MSMYAIRWHNLPIGVILIDMLSYLDLSEPSKVLIIVAVLILMDMLSYYIGRNSVYLTDMSQSLF